MGKGCLAQARRAVEQHMIKHVFTLAGSCYSNLEGLHHLALPDVFLKAFGAQVKRCAGFIIWQRCWISGQNFRAFAFNGHAYLVPL